MSQRYQPFVTVAVIVESQNQFLLVEEIPVDSDQVTFNQPAGHLEANESVIAAAERELLEETGLALTINEFVGIYQYFLPDKQFIRFTFKVALDSPVAIIPQDRQIIAGHWFSLEKIKQLPNLRSPLVVQSIEDYLRQGTQNTELLLKQFKAEN